MRKDLVLATWLGLALTFGPAAPAGAFIEMRHLDPMDGQRALDRASEHAGPLAPDEPQQVELEEAFTVTWEGYEIEAVRGFGIEAIVLSRKDYDKGDMGALVPMDLALAWGPVSDPEWIRHLRVSQSGRLYIWSYPAGTDLVQSEVERNSANMHIMPMNDRVRRTLASVGRGDLVRISGFLVNISNKDGFSWNTSLERSDTGLGACEIILVQDVEIDRG